MNFKQWLLIESIKKTPLLNDLHTYLTTQKISDKQFMIEFLNWFDDNQNNLREIEVNWKDRKKPYVVNYNQKDEEYYSQHDRNIDYPEYYTSELEMYLNDTVKIDFKKDFKHIQKIKEFLNNPKNYYYLREFKSYVLHTYINHNDLPEQAPTHRYYIFKQLLGSNNWLLHFANNAESIKKNGFLIGVENINDLPLTKIWGHARDKAGYNFAYLAKNYNSKNAPTTYLNTQSHQESSESGLLMFKSSGILVDHLADNNDEVIFDGKSVNPKNIVVIIPDKSSDYEKWIVKSQNPKSNDPFSGTLQQTIEWVMKNSNVYKNIIF